MVNNNLLSLVCSVRIREERRQQSAVYGCTVRAREEGEQQPAVSGLKVYT